MFFKEVENAWVCNPNMLGKEIIIWGIGEMGHTMYRTLISTKKCKLIGFYDSNPKGKKTCFGYEILSKEQLGLLSRDVPILVAISKNIQPILFELKDMGFVNIYTTAWPLVSVRYDTKKSKEIMANESDKIKQVYGLLADDESKKIFKLLLDYRMTNDINLIQEAYCKVHKQYFPGEDVFRVEENEVFIDAGCYNTNTIKDFKEWTNDTYKKVYAFEPSKEEKIVVDEYIEYRGFRAESIEAGLYNRNGFLSFSCANFGSSRIDDKGDDTIKVIRLDDFMQDNDEKITFIKMDIEGSELEALEGSEATIKKDHPKLAICVYHKFADLWEIPLWIYERFPEYKFYIRHHSETTNETVLYARYDA